MKRVNGVVAAVVVAGGMLAGGCSGQSGGGRSEMVANGLPPISYLVSGPGTLYVRDVTKGAVVHSGTYADIESPVLVEVGERVQLRDPENGERVTLVGEVSENDWYEIWFKPAEKAAAGKHATVAAAHKEKEE